MGAGAGASNTASNTPAPGCGTDVAVLKRCSRDGLSWTGAAAPESWAIVALSAASRVGAAARASVLEPAPDAPGAAAAADWLEAVADGGTLKERLAALLGLDTG